MLPASLPSIVGGLKQGWASIGVKLQQSRELNDAEGIIATMIVILVIGMLVDVVFAAANDAIRRRWGVLDNANG